MQKLVSIDGTSLRELEELNENDLSNGWNIKKMLRMKDDEIIILLEKDTRKEKLEKLNDISTH